MLAHSFDRFYVVTKFILPNILQNMLNMKSNFKYEYLNDLKL